MATSHNRVRGTIKVEHAGTRQGWQAGGQAGRHMCAQTHPCKEIGARTHDGRDKQGTGQGSLSVLMLVRCSVKQCHVQTRHETPFEKIDIETRTHTHTHTDDPRQPIPRMSRNKAGTGRQWILIRHTHKHTHTHTHARWGGTSGGYNWGGGSGRPPPRHKKGHKQSDLKPAILGSPQGRGGG